MSASLAEVLTLSELRDGLRASVEFSVTLEQMQRFAELSGDFNPLHTDEASARAKGFQGCVVYGALIVAKVSQLIGMRLPGRDSVWTSLALDFRKPLYIGQTAQVEGVVDNVSAATALISLKLTVRAAGTLIAKGSAEVVIVR